ncbi:MAG: tRNA pseudouridine(55) synthase TruB [Coriobacteriales bacterium]
MIDKPAGRSSHDVVNAVRAASGEGRVGHAGTLDPMATGVLVVLLGPYTRLEPYLSSAEKSYEATITFGSATDTDDAQGRVVAVAPVPDVIGDASRASHIVEGLVGTHAQVPPAYSAIKRGGRVSHRAARAGTPLELEPRHVRVLSARLTTLDQAAHSWTIDVTVSKGTYIRALARDLGETLGTKAHLSALRRTASGRITIAQATQLSDVVEAAKSHALATLFVDPFEALGLPVVHADSQQTATGAPLVSGKTYAEGTLVAVEADGRLAGVYHASGDLLVANAVLLGGPR